MLRPALSPSRQRRKHTRLPRPRPEKGVAPRQHVLRGLPSPSSPGRASSPPPSLALPQAWAARSGAGQQTGGSQLKPSREPGSRGSPGPLRSAGWALRPGRPGSGGQRLSLAVALTPGRGRAEGGAEGGGAEPGKPGPRGPQLSPWREGTQPPPLLHQGVSHHTGTPPSHVQARRGARGAGATQPRAARLRGAAGPVRCETPARAVGRDRVTGHERPL